MVEYKSHSSTSESLDILRSNDLPFSDLHTGSPTLSPSLSQQPPVLQPCGTLSLHPCQCYFFLPVIPFPISRLPVRHLLTYCPKFGSSVTSLLTFVCSLFLCTSSFLPFRAGKLTSPTTLYIYIFTHLFPHFTLKALPAQVSCLYCSSCIPALSKGLCTQKALSKCLLNRWVDGWKE